ncbi:MAG: hypothetical protein EBZ69_10440, partial [Alphaproteobacteria bacterium]|nr:hypothetical protein [Alphaproteobacteria bacterium]
EQQKRELPDLTLAKSMVDACEADVQKKQEQLQAAEQAEHDADATAKEAQQKVDAAQHELTKLRAEETALRDLLESQRGLEQRVLDLLEGTGGFETALAVAFGEALTAALNDEAPSYWQQRTLAAPLPPLPVGAEPLSQLVQAPAELQSLLSMTGLVNSDDEGRALAAQLLPGQILVTRDGWAWRWDGYTITPKAHRLRAGVFLRPLCAEEVFAAALRPVFQEAAPAFAVHRPTPSGACPSHPSEAWPCRAVVPNPKFHRQSVLNEC